MGSYEFPKNFFRLIENQLFRSRISMFIGEESISKMYMYMQGAFHIIQMKNLEEKKEVIKFLEFHQWVANYYNVPLSGEGWLNLILRHCEGNEKKALEKFFTLYDKFKNDE